MAIAARAWDLIIAINLLLPNLPCVIEWQFLITLMAYVPYEYLRGVRMPLSSLGRSASEERKSMGYIFGIVVRNTIETSACRIKLGTQVIL